MRASELLGGSSGFQEVPFARAAGTGQTIDGLSVDRLPGGLGLHTLLSGPEIGRRSSTADGWRYAPIWTNEAQVACVHEEVCGRAFATSRGEFILDGFEGSQTTSLVSPGSCASPLLVDESSECAISAALELRPDLAGGIREVGTIYSADRRGDAVVVVGTRGPVLELKID